jgi:hypothetical protein
MDGMEGWNRYSSGSSITKENGFRAVVRMSFLKVISDRLGG